MDFIDYAWDDIAGTFVKENILGSEFSFSTKTDIQVSIDYIPKIQARKIYTFAKEQLEELKNGASAETKSEPVFEEPIQAQPIATFEEPEVIEEMETEEVTNFAEIIPVSGYRDEKQHPDPSPEMTSEKEKSLAELSSEELFDKLQNYKKLLDNGLILQGEYDSLKKDILGYM